MAQDNFSGSFKWFLAGGVALFASAIIILYVPVAALRWAALVPASLGLFALVQSYRTAKVYRASRFLITTGAAIMLMAPVFAHRLMVLVLIVVDIVAGLLGYELDLSTRELLKGIFRPQVTAADLFMSLVGGWLIARGLKHWGEETAVVTLKSDEEIKDRAQL